MRLQLALIIVCLATIAAIVVVHHRTRTVVPVDDVIVYTSRSGLSERSSASAQAPRLGAAVFGGSGLSRSEMQEGARRYQELLEEARAAADAPAPAPRGARARPAHRDHARAGRPAARRGSATVRPYRRASRPGIYTRAERHAIRHRPSVFERSRHYQERGSVYPLGAYDQSARQRRIYSRR